MKGFLVVVIVVIILLIILLYTQYQTVDKIFCQNDADCVPAQCCHPTSCVNINYKPNCTGIACTMVCEGPIDCGSGSCKCVNNKCQVVPTK